MTPDVILCSSAAKPALALLGQGAVRGRRQPNADGKQLAAVLIARERLQSSRYAYFAAAEYNQRLSGRRAESARQYLIAQHGIDPHRLTAKGYGKARLMLPNEPASELNRRVQFQNPNYQTAAAAAPASHPVASSPAPAAPPVQPTPAPQADGL